MALAGETVAVLGASMLVGLVFFYSTFSMSKWFLQTKCSHKALPLLTIHRISARIVSGLQGIAACVAGAIMASTCHDVINDYHWLAAGYTGFLSAYLYFDFFLDYNLDFMVQGPRQGGDKNDWRSLLNFLYKDPAMTFHHLALPLMIIPIILLVRRGSYFFGCFLFAESVLPFKAYRDICCELERTMTLDYLVNGVLFIAFFIASRFLVYPYMWSTYASQIDVPLLSVPGRIPLQCNLYCFIYFLLNVFFMVRIYHHVRVEGGEWLQQRWKAHNKDQERHTKDLVNMRKEWKTKRL